MKEVTSTIVMNYIKMMELKGIDPDKVLNKLPYSRNHYYIPGKRIDWTEYVLIFKELKKLGLTDEDFFDLGKLVGTWGWPIFFKRLINTMVSVKSIYRISLGFVVPNTCRNMESSYSISGNIIEFTYSVSEEYEVVDEMAIVTKGVFEVYPTLLGYAPANVHCELTPRGADYKIYLPPEVSLWQRLKRKFISLSSFKDHWFYLMQVENEFHDQYETSLKLEQDLYQFKDSISYYSKLKSRYQGIFNHSNDGIAIFSTDQPLEKSTLIDVNATGEALLNRSKSELLGTFESNVFNDSDSYTQSVSICKKGSHTHVFNIKEASCFVHLIQDDVKLLNVINKLSALSFSHLDLKDMLTDALKVIVTAPIIGLQNKGSIFLSDDTKQTLKLLASINFDFKSESKCTQVKFGDCFCGKAAVEQDVVFYDLNNLHSKKQNCNLLGHEHYIVPLVRNKVTLGVLCLYLDVGHLQLLRESYFLKTLGQVLTTLINNYYKDDETSKINQRIIEINDKTREKISFELKDKVQLPLTKINLSLNNTDCVDEVIGSCKQGLKELDNIRLNLNALNIERGSLLKAIDGLVERFGSDQKLRAQFQTNLDENCSFSKKQQTNIYRVVFESLTNIKLHAEATNILVSITNEVQKETEIFKIIIKDDGKGFDLNEKLAWALENHHMGIIGLDERAKILNGKTTIVTKKGKGTKVELICPVNCN